MKNLKKSLLSQSSKFPLTPLSNDSLKEKLFSDNFFWKLKENKDSKMSIESPRSLFPLSLYMTPGKLLTRNLKNAMFHGKKDKLRLITDPSLFKILEKQMDFIKYQDLYFNTTKIYKISYDLIKEKIIVLCGMDYKELLQMNENDYSIKILEQEKFTFKIYIKKNLKDKNTMVSLGTKILFKFGETQVNEIFKGPESLKKIDYNQQNYIEFYVRYGFCEMKDFLKGTNLYKLKDAIPVKIFNITKIDVKMHISDINFLNKNQIFNN